MCTLLCVVCNTQCAVCCVQYSVCNNQCAVCFVQYSVCNTQCAIFSVQYSVCNTQCAVCCVQNSVRNTQCAICCVQYSVCSMLCAILSVQCAVRRNCPIRGCWRSVTPRMAIGMTVSNRPLFLNDCDVVAMVPQCVVAIVHCVQSGNRQCATVLQRL